MILDNYPKDLFLAYPKELRSFPKELIRSDEFKFHFKQKLNNEFILSNGKKFVSDLPHMTFEDIIISLEFQSYKIREDKETVFNVYQAELHNEHKKHVITVVFSMQEDEHKLITHKINPYDGLTMLIVSLTALNQKQTINNSFYKLTNNIGMSDKDYVLFLLAPLMEKGNAVEILKNNIRLIAKAKNLSKEVMDVMMFIQLNFASNWFSEDDFEEIGGLVMCLLTPEAKECWGEVFKKIIEKRAREEGREEEKRGIVLNMLSNDFSHEEISKITGLSIDEISHISLSN